MARTPDDYRAQFIVKAQAIYGERYDYSRFVWTGAQSKGVIVCPAHGPFDKSPEKHIQRRQGCRKCSNEQKSKDRSYTLEVFIEKAVAVHGDANDYAEFVYTDSQTKGWITCKLHNVRFEQTPAHHLMGHTGCDDCIQAKSITTHRERRGADHHSQTEAFREKVKTTSLERFGVEHHSKIAEFRDVMRVSTMERYGVEFASQLPEFQQKVRTTNRKRYGAPHYNSMHIPEDAQRILADRDAIVERLKTKSLAEVARDCNITESTMGKYCHRYGIELSQSTYEDAITAFLRSHGITVQRGGKKLIPPWQIDMFLPDYGVGIEFCGLYYHTQERDELYAVEGEIEPFRYHLNKLQMMNALGYRLITIFEDEWLHKRSIVEKRLLHISGKSPRGKGARQLEISRIGGGVARRFLNEHHLQGGGPHGFARYGAYDSDELVAVMTFVHPRQALGRKSGYDELLRFATNGRSYPGIASRMFRRFLVEYDVQGVISYADRRWSDGGLYERMGFKLTGHTELNYWYLDLKEKRRENRILYRKSVIRGLVQDGANKTEHEIMKEIGRTWMWDCGSLVYHWESGV